MKIDFELILTEKNGKFVAQCPQFPKQKGIGATEREALESLAKAISGAVENAMGKIMKEVFSSGLGEMQDKILDKIDTRIDSIDSLEDSGQKSDLKPEVNPEIKSDSKSSKKLNSTNKRKMILSAQLGQLGQMSQPGSNNMLFNDLLNFAKGSFLDAGGSQPPQNGSQSSLFNRSSLGAGFGLDSKGTNTPKPRPMMPYLIETGMGDGFIIAIPLSSN